MNDKMGLAALLAVVFLIGVAAGVTIDRIIRPDWSPQDTKQVLDDSYKFIEKLDKLEKPKEAPVENKGGL